MKVCSVWGAVVLAWIGGGAVAVADGGAKGDGKGEAAIDHYEMDVLADGHYLVQLTQQGETWTANFRAKSGRLECVAAVQESLIGMKGAAEKMANGVFIVRVRNDRHAASQVWAIQGDGGAVVTESPDRGERHRVWRVADGAVLKQPESK